MLIESTLQDLLARESLSQDDKILCCLAIDPDKPKRVAAIKALASRNGLAEIKKWNVLAQLNRKGKFAFKTAQGWELTTDGLAHVEALAKAITKTSVISATDGETDTYALIPTHRILIIEDDKHTLQLLEYIFARAGYEVLTAVDGREAQAFLNNEPAVDLIVTGLMLPYISGYQIIIDAKQNATWMHVPIIVLSGKVLEMDIVRALNLGANDYVIKPFRPRELLARTRRLIITYEYLRKIR